MSLRRLLHIHRARPTGRVGGHIIERCRCQMARAVVIRGHRPVWWSRWHPTAADAVREADTIPRWAFDALAHTSRPPSWLELWRRSGRA